MALLTQMWATHFSLMKPNCCLYKTSRPFRIRNPPTFACSAKRDAFYATLNDNLSIDSKSLRAALRETHWPGVKSHVTPRLIHIKSDLTKHLSQQSTISSADLFKNVTFRKYRTHII